MPVVAEEEPTYTNVIQWGTDVDDDRDYVNEVEQVGSMTLAPPRSGEGSGANSPGPSLGPSSVLVDGDEKYENVLTAKNGECGLYLNEAATASNAAAAAAPEDTDIDYVNTRDDEFGFGDLLPSTPAGRTHLPSPASAVSTPQDRRVSTSAPTPPPLSSLARAAGSNSTLPRGVTLAPAPPPDRISTLPRGVTLAPAPPPDRAPAAANRGAAVVPAPPPDRISTLPRGATLAPAPPPDRAARGVASPEPPPVPGGRERVGTFSPNPVPPPVPGGRERVGALSPNPVPPPVPGGRERVGTNMVSAPAGRGAVASGKCHRPSPCVCSLAFCLCPNLTLYIYIYIYI